MLKFRSLMLCAIVPFAIVASKSEWATDLIRAITAQDVRDEMARDEAFQRQLDEEDRVIQRQIELKERWLSELIAGRKTLMDVTGQFMVLNQAHPNYQFVLEREFPGASLEERTARNVMYFAEAEMSGRFPTRKLPVMARLEAEFQAHFASRKAANQQPSQ